MSDAFSRILNLDREEYKDLTPVDNTSGDAFARITGDVAAEPGASIDFSQPKETVRAQIKALPKAQRKDAMRKWADTFVAKERSENAGPMQYASDVVRNLARGTPVGSWLDEANAATSSLFGGNYDEALAYERAKDRAIDKESTRIGRVPVIGDVTVGGMQKLAGGIASAPIAPLAQVMRGSATLPNIVNGAVNGLMYGGLYGAGHGEGTENRLMTGGLGMAAGAVGGAAIPVIAEGAGRAVNALRSPAPTPPPLRQYHPGAVRRVQRAFNDDFDATRPGLSASRRYHVRSGNLGNEGMLADMGPNMQNQAGAIASMPGAGQARMTETLRNRARGSQGRINADVDAALGPRQNLVAAEEAATTAARANAQPLYDQFYQTPIPMTPDLARLMQRADAAGVMNRVARLMQIEGIQPGSVANNGRLVDLVKRAIDDMADGARRSGENNLFRLYSNLSRSIRNEVDTALSPNDPTQSLWAQARRAAGEGMQYQEGLEAGGAAFARNLSPDQMAADLGRMTPIGVAGFQQGARGQIRETMGNAATKFGENASARGRTMLGSENARRKVNMLTTPDQARGLVRRLDAEANFDATYQNVLQNSKTASRQAAQQEFPAPTDGTGAANEIGKKSITGLAMEAGYRALNGLLSGALNERRVQVARDAADMLLQQGVARDQIAHALLQQAQRMNLSAQRQQAVDNLVRYILQGSGPQALSVPLNYLTAE